MKKLLLSFILLFNSLLAIAQCTTDANNFGNNTTTGYGISGDVNIVLNTNNTVTLNLGSNFSTANGPDIRAYLVNSNGLNDTQLQNSLIEDLINIELGLVGCGFGLCSPAISASGAKSFTIAIPNGQDIRDYDKIFFYCLNFNQFWDFGSFTPFTDANCSVLSVNENATQSSFKVSPNPATNYINIQNSKQEIVSINVYNVLGKEVLKINESKLSNIKLNLSSLKSGIYLLKTTSNSSTHITRFIKQ